MTAQKKASDLIEHDCMSCGESWDVKVENGPMELCKYCGSNDVHRRPGVKYNHAHAEYPDERYHGPDIFDQYGVY